MTKFYTDLFRMRIPYKEIQHVFVTNNSMNKFNRGYIEGIYVLSILQELYADYLSKSMNVIAPKTFDSWLSSVNGIIVVDDENCPSHSPWFKPTYMPVYSSCNYNFYSALYYPKFGKPKKVLGFMYINFDDGGSLVNVLSKYYLPYNEVNVLSKEMIVDFENARRNEYLKQGGEYFRRIPLDTRIDYYNIISELGYKFDFVPKSKYASREMSDGLTFTETLSSASVLAFTRKPNSGTIDTTVFYQGYPDKVMRSLGNDMLECYGYYDLNQLN